MALSKCFSLSNPIPRINETGMHGTPDFPIAIYNDNVTIECVNWHWSEELDVGIVTEGSVLLACGNCKYTLSEGDIFFVNSNVLHFMGNADPPKKSAFRSIVFHGSLIGGDENSVFHQKYLLPIIGNPNLRELTVKPNSIYHKRLSKLLTNVWDLILSESPDYEIVVRSELSELFRILLHMPENNVVIYSESNFIQENRVRMIMDHINAHYSESITLDELAKAVSVSKSEVLRCFKNIVGQSPIQYLKNYRLQAAAYLLKNTDYSVGTICELCGFGDNSYFAKSFKEMYHCSPREYEKRGNAS
ncbi:MAG: AraC family transcriptional regulator [Bacteroides sp.]|nr:AraC family transcriptional regulator [Eubacterium sp.]MCM1419556.1 AraC family transcriptional regulator [Roseburia sp.]MCM1461505.1 AraC family transcriptional regulator [Bacteroides sp.]